LGFEKSQSSVTHDSLRYVNILTYLLTYLLTERRQTDGRRHIANVNVSSCSLKNWTSV